MYEGYVPFEAPAQYSRTKTLVDIELEGNSDFEKIEEENDVHEGKRSNSLEGSRSL